MKTFEKATVDVGGKQVDVDTEEIQNASGIPTVKVTAVYGSTVVERIRVFGPIDGAHAALDPDHVQRGLDDTRAKAAKKAVFLDELATQLANAK